jgi:hypothetical protein
MKHHPLKEFITDLNKIENNLLFINPVIHNPVIHPVVMRFPKTTPLATPPRSPDAAGRQRLHRCIA